MVWRSKINSRFQNIISLPMNNIFSCSFNILYDPQTCVFRPCGFSKTLCLRLIIIIGKSRYLDVQHFIPHKLFITHPNMPSLYLAYKSRNIMSMAIWRILNILSSCRWHTDPIQGVHLLLRPCSQRHVSHQCGQTARSSQQLRPTEHVRVWLQGCGERRWCVPFCGVCAF